MADKFKGEPSSGLHLKIKARDNHQAKVGNKVALVFYLHNRSKQKVEVTTGGSCKTVHEAGFMVIDPKGRLHQSLGRIKVGGFHTCRQYTETLNIDSSVRLDTQTDSENMIQFEPAEVGRYVVIGTYDLPTKEQPERRALSAPILLDVKGN
jgi:hypothetical protein